MTLEDFFTPPKAAGYLSDSMLGARAPQFESPVFKCCLNAEIGACLSYNRVLDHMTHTEPSMQIKSKQFGKNSVYLFSS